MEYLYKEGIWYGQYLKPVKSIYIYIGKVEDNQVVRSAFDSFGLGITFHMEKFC